MFHTDREGSYSIPVGGVVIFIVMCSCTETWVAPTSAVSHIYFILQITVLVVDLNDNPPIFNPVNYAATVLECSLNGTTVNTIYATDADATAKNRIIIYTIVSGNPNSKL